MSVFSVTSAAAPVNRSRKMVSFFMPSRRGSPVFVVGSDRSGTTLLRLMLNANPALHIPKTSRFLPGLRDRQESYGDFTQPQQRWFFIRDLQSNWATPAWTTFSIFELSSSQAEDEIRLSAPTDLAGAIAALFRASARLRKKSRWGRDLRSYPELPGFHGPTRSSIRPFDTRRQGRRSACCKRAGFRT